MSFSEKLKKEVRKNCNYRCCRCQKIGVEIHHIIPQASSGPDDIENAAPLCPSCHNDFGGNPEKRKQIKEMRDHWYEKCAEMQYVDGEKLEEINREVLALKKEILELGFSAKSEAILYQVVPDPNIYFYTKDTIRRIPDPKTLAMLGFRWDQVLEINQEELDKYEQLTAFDSVRKMQLIKNRNVYYGLINGELRPIPNERVLNYIINDCGNRKDATVIEDIKGFTKGAPLCYP